MGKLYFFVVGLGLFLAVSFGFILPATLSSAGDLGVVFSAVYLFGIVPTVGAFFISKIIAYGKAWLETLNKKSEKEHA